MNKSVSTINSPEFINLKPLDINPLMSECEIKVLYVGENRNHTFISKEVATEMAKTLRGAPIVGYYLEDKQDFADHGERVIIDHDGVKFECMTKPYGFVSPVAQVWFQTFEDTNEFGEVTTREYLMTTGYLWTGQFEECKSAVEGEGKPHSMELDPDSLDGHWAENSKGMDFFIINDAIFSKLCILGEDVEPCFEGSSVKAPDVSASFAKVDDTFKHTLFTMMQDLQTALKGGQQMEDNTIVVTEPVVEPVTEPVVEPFAASQEPVVEPTTEPEVDPIVEPEADPTPVVEGDPAPQVDPVPPVVEPVEEPVVEPAPAEPTVEEQYAALQAAHEELQARFAALENEKAELQNQLSTLQTAHDGLVEFKRQYDDAKKDEMIEKFYMLTDEDKQEIIANKANYSVEDIEEKLSVICFRKKVVFNLDDSSKNNNITEPPVVYSYNDVGTNEPAWVTAVKNTKKNRI